MPAPEKIGQLVETFARHLDDYKSGTFNEAQVRQEFVNPLFKCLGWDMDNEQGLAEAYKDVIFEDSLRIGESTKAPDYCFKIGREKKFGLSAY